MPYANREAKRRYQRERAARIRSEFLDGKSCVACGATRDLQVHHVDPAAKTSHSVWSWSRPRREAELAKCEVRCRTCHEEQHRQARSAFASGRARDEFGAFL